MYVCASSEHFRIRSIFMLEKWFFFSLFFLSILQQINFIHSLGWFGCCFYPLLYATPFSSFAFSCSSQSFFSFPSSLAFSFPCNEIYKLFFFYFSFYLLCVFILESFYGTLFYASIDITILLIIRRTECIVSETPPISKWCKIAR